MSSFEYFIAKRYFKTKRRTGFISIISYISIGGVTVGVAALILVLSVMNGFEQEVRSRLLGADAHVRLRKFYFQPIEKGDSLAALARGLPHVQGASPTIVDKGMIAGKDNQYATVFKAVDPETAADVTDIKNKMILGSLDFSVQEIDGEKLPGIVLGKYLADAIRCTHIGDIVNIWTMPKSGGIFTQPRIMRFYVTGLVEMGYYEYDKTFSYMSIKDAQELLDMPEQVTWIEIKLDDYEKAGETAEALTEELGYPYHAETWYQLNRSLYTWMEIEKWGSFIILSLIIMVAAFNIISSLIMLVMEKTKEIGILRSIGATEYSIRKIFIYQGMLVGVIGTILGSVVGYALGFMQYYFHLITLPGDVYLINALPIVMQWKDFFAIASVSIILSLLASFYPAHRASKLIPVEAIRYE
jgi:lipoprotein-releasing system permease protein